MAELEFQFSNSDVSLDGLLPDMSVAHSKISVTAGPAGQERPPWEEFCEGQDGGCCQRLQGALTGASSGTGSVRERGGAQSGAPGSKEEEKVEWRVWTAQSEVGWEWGEDREWFLERDFCNDGVIFFMCECRCDGASWVREKGGGQGGDGDPGVRTPQDAREPDGRPSIGDSATEEGGERILDWGFQPCFLTLGQRP